MPALTPARGATTVARSASLTALVLVTSIMAGAAPAAGAASCDVTALEWSELSSAMLSDVQTVCLGASITGVVGHLTVGAASKTLDLRGFDLEIAGEDRSAAIDVPSGHSLTLQATGGGSLIARGGTEGAGIGGSGDSRIGQHGHSGSITIHSGTYSVAGGMSAAGIGAGWGGDAGPVVINGGTVRAISGPYAGGIGGGDGGDGGEVRITGGILTVEGGYLGAGVGGGVYGAGGDVTISGGRLSVAAGCRAATIGAGAAGTAPGTLTVAGLSTPVASGAGSTQPCSEHPVGISPTTAIADGAPGVSVVMEAHDETASSSAWTGITYFSEVVTSVDGVVTAIPQGPVPYGDTVGALPAVTSADGRSLDSWRVGGPDGPAFDAATPITAPLVLYARWVDASAPAELAATGTSRVGAAGAVGACLLAAGLALLIVRRRAAVARVR